MVDTNSIDYHLRSKGIFHLDDAYQDIENVCGIADDIIVAGETPQEHDDAMLKMLEASRKNNISLNSEKLQFKQQKVDFYGHRLSGKGIQRSEDKLQAIKNIKTPTNPKELQQILGMMTYLNRFSTKLAKMTAPLRKLLKNGSTSDGKKRIKQPWT